MESFYGGRPGFPFILRKGYYSQQDIQNAVTNKELVYGDYALIDGDTANTADRGKIYRVQADLSLMYIGRITSPAISTILNPQAPNDMPAGATNSDFLVVAPDNENTSSKMIYQLDTTSEPSELKISFTEPYTELNFYTVPYCNGIDTGRIWQGNMKPQGTIGNNAPIFKNTNNNKYYGWNGTDGVEIVGLTSINENQNNNHFIKNFYVESSTPVFIASADDKPASYWGYHEGIVFIMEDK